ncbi:MAG: S8 family serine peptidase, partial [Gammaproteobacteria bacterium]
MKIILAIFALFVLSACGGGGGGGGGAPSLTPPPSSGDSAFLTEAQQVEARQAAADLRREVEALADSPEKDEILRAIDALRSDIEDARRIIESLTEEIQNLRTQLANLTPSPAPDPPPDPQPELPVAGCTDFRVRNAAGDCTYDTREYLLSSGLRGINALYAYEQGYHGQGVTVVNAERVLASHEELRENVLTIDIGLDCSNLFDGRADRDESREFVMKYNCDRFAVNASAALVSMYDVPPASLELYGIEYYHGTASGAVIVAERNGEIPHGVAPHSKLVPVPYPSSFRLAGDTSDLEWIIDNEIPLVSHSIFLARFTPFSVIREHYRMFEDTDTVLVWAGGNTGTAWATTQMNQVTVPVYEPKLEDNWLVVAAVGGPPSALTVSTIPCGEIMRWCITAPGFFQRIPVGPNNDDYFYAIKGSSAATPQVAGALAVLKSAANKFDPDFPMTMVRAILLTTATDLCATGGDCKDGVDEVYGWGLVNISAGIVHIENMETAGGILLRDLRGRLPAEFSHLRGRMDSVSVAVKITEDSFYNLALGSLITPGDSESSSAKIGGAAKGIMADSALRYRGARAFGDSENGFGFRYGGGDDSFFYTAEFSRGARREGFAGSDFGALGSVSSRTHGGK